MTKRNTQRDDVVEVVLISGIGKLTIMMSNIYGKGAKCKATKLHAQLVRSRGSCENCESIQNLQCAHIISRKYSWTRTALDNAYGLCACCHRYFTANPIEFAQFTIAKMGEEKYQELFHRRNSIEKFDWDAEVTRLTLIAAERGI